MFGGREFWAMLGEGVEKPEGRGCPREREAQKGLTSSILIHHAQPLCLVLSLEGIEIQDTAGLHQCLDTLEEANFLLVLQVIQHFLQKGGRSGGPGSHTGTSQPS